MQLIPGAMSDRVWEVLSDAAIDWKIDDNGSTYVTSLDFPFWLDVLGGGERIQELLRKPEIVAKAMDATRRYRRA